MVPEFLRYYYPYGHLMLGLYGAFSLFICFLAARYLYFRLKEEAAAQLILREMEKEPESADFKKSALIDDLPYILPEAHIQLKAKENASVLL